VLRYVIKIVPAHPPFLLYQISNFRSDIENKKISCTGFTTIKFTKQGIKTWPRLKNNKDVRGKEKIVFPLAHPSIFG
jgi:hypothetical protein